MVGNGYQISENPHWLFKVFEGWEVEMLIFHRFFMVFEGLEVENIDISLVFKVFER